MEGLEMCFKALPKLFSVNKKPDFITSKKLTGQVINFIDFEMS